MPFTGRSTVHQRGLGDAHVAVGVRNTMGGMARRLARAVDMFLYHCYYWK